MSNPFSGKPKWKGGKWGEMPVNTITPMPPAPKATPQSQTPADQSKKGNLKRYVIPIAIVLFTLIAVVVVAVIIILVRHRNSKKSGQLQKKFSTVDSDDDDKVPKMLPGNVPTSLPKNTASVIPIAQPPRPLSAEPQSQVEDQLHTVADVAKKLGLDQKEKSPTTRELMEQYAKTLSERSEQDEPDDRPAQTPKDSAPATPVPTKSVVQSMRIVAQKVTEQKDQSQKPAPALPRLSYRDIDELSRTAGQKSPRVKPVPEEKTALSPKTAAAPVRSGSAEQPSNRKKTHMTAAYLQRLLEALREEQMEAESDVQEEGEDEIGVVEEDEEDTQEEEAAATQNDVGAVD